MLFVPYAPAADCRPQTPQRRRANRFALALFTLAALVGLSAKFLW